MLNNPTGPTLLGFDVILVGTILAAVAAVAVMLAIYAAVTVRDPMAKRVKALNERREQLKAGIVASTNKRKSIVNKNQAADKVRGILSAFKMVQGSQIQDIQVKLLQAGIRTKDLAFFIIFGRLILPGPQGQPGAAPAQLFVVPVRHASISGRSAWPPAPGRCIGTAMSPPDYRPEPTLEIASPPPPPPTPPAPVYEPAPPPPPPPVERPVERG